MTVTVTVPMTVTVTVPVTVTVTVPVAVTVTVAVTVISAPIRSFSSDTNGPIRAQNFCRLANQRHGFGLMRSPTHAHYPHAHTTHAHTPHHARTHTHTHTCGVLHHINQPTVHSRLATQPRLRIRFPCAELFPYMVSGSRLCPSLLIISSLTLRQLLLVDLSSLLLYLSVAGPHLCDNCLTCVDWYGLYWQAARSKWDNRRR